MKSITEQLFELGNGIIKIGPEVADSTGRYHMADDGGVETEVGEFLYGLIKVLQPENILETGTYTGVSALYMGAALKDNGHGLLTTIEYERFHKDRAEKLWQKCDVSQYILCELKSSLDFQPDRQYELIFLDSEPQIRFQELEKFFPHLKPGGFIGIHDCPPSMCQGNFNPDHPEMKSYPFGDIPNNMREWLANGQLIKFHLPTPRGLVFFYKPKEEDYKE